ncbi:hypothetical protein H0A36_19525 [Endozoicomonas sp. SM1973]|uniref:Uncharacterized protein n=1 Tax=Spartinivicinus marinus TaxID=2994442 RepID=A0A853I4C4_9GAMM|nr:hypothetical protein [Spartinivicinus marinus]MCX4027542.1 hypothetical protein [Spartinivicinus marinus]NYZ68213.1 hypothetical protein [Spartinivicinus marinus]
MERLIARHYFFVFLLIIIVSLFVNLLLFYFQEETKKAQKNNHDTNNLILSDVKVDLLSLKKQLNKLTKSLQLKQSTMNHDKNIVLTASPYELILQDIQKLSEQINKFHPAVEIAETPSINGMSESENVDVDPMLLAEQQHFAQPVDDTWATETIYSIRQAISVGEIEGASLNNIDCRTNSCKLDLSFEQSGQVEPAIDKIVSRVNWDHQHTLKMSEKGLQIIFSGQSL